MNNALKKLLDQLPRMPEGADANALPPAGTIQLVVLDHTGHSGHRWTQDDKLAIAIAHQAYVMMRSQGYVVYKRGPDGRDSVMTEFDPTALEMNGYPQPPAEPTSEGAATTATATAAATDTGTSITARPALGGG